MRNLAPFNMGKVVKKLNRIRINIRDKFNRPFPKPKIFWLSRYAYQPRHIKIHPDGRIVGGLPRFVSSLIDFSFVRAIVAHKYSFRGQAYDPVTILLLELFRYLEKYPNMKEFVETLHDPEKGRHYRLYAGIKNHIPSEGTFTHFKDRLGEKLYNQIFHVLVKIVEFLRLITEVIRGTDRHQKLKALRSAAERTNATAKEDFSILSKPKIRGLEHASILSQMAVMVVLLKRVACFIVRVTLLLRKNLQNNKTPRKFFVPGPSVSKFILNLVQRLQGHPTKSNRRQKSPEGTGGSVFHFLAQAESARISYRGTKDFPPFRPFR